MNKKELLDILEKNQKGIASKQEQETLETFFENRKKHAPVPWNKWELSEKERIKFQMYQSIQDHIKKDAVLVKNSIHWLRRPAIVAASILLLMSVGLGAYFYSRSQELTTVLSSADGIRSFTLPDGSSVTLNRFSSLNYAEGFGDGHRNLELDGEAYFEVERDEYFPFIINSNGTKTTVLGTSFNVLSYPGEPSIVTVKTGKVEVTRKDKSVTLLPGQQAIASSSDLKQNELRKDLEINFLWQDGDLVIPNLMLDQALSRIAKYYDYDLTINSASDLSCKLRGVFSKDDSLSDILYGLKYSYEEFNYELEEGEIIIDAFSCK
ncbi:MAG: FecR domain-containing protein [Bacteroidota bacterium]